MSKIINKIINEELHKALNKKDAGCGCGCGCGGKKKNAPILKESKVKDLLSEGLTYHIDNKISLSESEYKVGSEEYLALIRESRKLYSRGIIEVSEADKELLETDLGHFGEYKGELVPLDLPMLNEDYSILDLYKITDKLKKQGFSVKIKPDRFDKGMYDVTHLGGDLDDLQLALNDIFGRDNYRIVFDENLNESELEEAEYQGRKVKLNKPMRGDVKKFKVYVKNPKGNVVKVNFGDPNMRIKKSDPARRRSFRARHNCDNPGPKTKARYWSCRAW